jgi:hypothetical protein
VVIKHFVRDREVLKIQINSDNCEYSENYNLEVTYIAIVLKYTANYIKNQRREDEEKQNFPSIVWPYGYYIV